jgi:hypothetical protein
MKVKHNIIDRHLKLSKNHTRVICNISFSHQIYQWMNARTYNIFCTVIKLDYKLTIIKIAKCSVLLKVKKILSMKLVASKPTTQKNWFTVYVNQKPEKCNNKIKEKYEAKKKITLHFNEVLEEGCCFFNAFNISK